jgi:hypothetical protein
MKFVARSHGRRQLIAQENPYRPVEPNVRTLRGMEFGFAIRKTQVLLIVQILEKLIRVRRNGRRPRLGKRVSRQAHETKTNDKEDRNRRNAVSMVRAVQIPPPLEAASHTDIPKVSAGAQRRRLTQCVAVILFADGSSNMRYEAIMVNP